MNLVFSRTRASKPISKITCFPVVLMLKNQISALAYRQLPINLMPDWPEQHNNKQYVEYIALAGVERPRFVLGLP